MAFTLEPIVNVAAEDRFAVGDSLGEPKRFEDEDEALEVITLIRFGLLMEFGSDLAEDNVPLVVFRQTLEDGEESWVDHNLNPVDAPA